MSSAHNHRVTISSPAISSNVKSDATPKSKPADTPSHQAPSPASSSEKDTTDGASRPGSAAASSSSSVSAASVVVKAGAWLSAASTSDEQVAEGDTTNQAGLIDEEQASLPQSHGDDFSMLEGPLNDEPRVPLRPTAVSYECSHLAYFAALDAAMFDDDDDDEVDGGVVVDILQGIQDRLLARHLRNGTLAAAEGRTAEGGAGGTAECRTFLSFGRKRRFGQID